MVQTNKSSDKSNVWGSHINTVDSSTLPCDMALSLFVLFILSSSSYWCQISVSGGQTAWGLPPCTESQLEMRHCVYTLTNLHPNPWAEVTLLPCEQTEAPVAYPRSAIKTWSRIWTQVGWSKKPKLVPFCCPVSLECYRKSEWGSKPIPLLLLFKFLGCKPQIRDDKWPVRFTGLKV